MTNLEMIGAMILPNVGGWAGALITKKNMENWYEVSALDMHFLPFKNDLQMIYTWKCLAFEEARLASSKLGNNSYLFILYALLFQPVRENVSNLFRYLDQFGLFCTLPWDTHPTWFGVMVGASKVPPGFHSCFMAHNSLSTGLGPQYFSACIEWEPYEHNKLLNKSEKNI